jgi:hypothetical protein
MGLKRLELFTDYGLEQELGITEDEATRDYIAGLLRERSEHRAEGRRELFRDREGRTKPGYMTTSELIAELGSEPGGTGRYAELAIEAAQRAQRDAFPAGRVPEMSAWRDGMMRLISGPELES